MTFFLEKKIFLGNRAPPPPPKFNRPGTPMSKLQVKMQGHFCFIKCLIFEWLVWAPSVGFLMKLAHAGPISFRALRNFFRQTGAAPPNFIVQVRLWLYWTFVLIVDAHWIANMLCQTKWTKSHKKGFISFLSNGRTTFEHATFADRILADPCCQRKHSIKNL